MGCYTCPLPGYSSYKTTFPQQILLLLAGFLIPTLLVDPFLLGLGTVSIMLGSFMVSRQFDPNFRGEWLSVNTLLMNGVSIWALLAPAIRRDLTGINDKL